MAVPKKKMSRSRRDMRRYHPNQLPKATGYVKCSECGEIVRPHRMCSKLFDCAYYQERVKTTAKTKSPAPATT